MGSFWSWPDSSSDESRHAAQRAVELTRHLHRLCAAMRDLCDAASIKELTMIYDNMVAMNVSRLMSRTSTDILSITLAHPRAFHGSRFTWPQLKKFEDIVYRHYGALHHVNKLHRRYNALRTVRNHPHTDHASRSLYGNVKRHTRKLMYQCLLHRKFVTQLLHATTGPRSSEADQRISDTTLTV